MPNCAVDGCDSKAVVKLVGADGFDKAYRCEDCLVFDLEL